MTVEDKIRQMVRRVVYRTVGREPIEGPRSLVTQEDVQKVPVGGEMPVPEGALLTPLARQEALERKVRLVESSGSSGERWPHGEEAEKTVAIGADHGGFSLKEQLKEQLAELGWQVADCGTHSEESVDYPDYALAVAQLVAQGRAARGIVVDGAGIGSCMVANKVPGVRAALCYDQATALNSRVHNHANVLTLGAGLIGPGLARQIVEAWLETPEGGGRHARRVAQIMDVERRYLRAR